MGGGGGSSGDQRQEVRFAPYIEAIHESYLNNVHADVETIKLTSPYDGYTDLDIEASFFGTGYVLASFPSLYDMYGKFMAGLDIDVLYDEIFEETINGTEVSNLINAEASILEDDLVENAYPRFESGMRDINAVMSSTFITGKAMMETARTKAISRFSADIRYKLLPVVTERWKTHLIWNQQVISQYIEVMKFYFMSKMDVDNHNFEIAAKDALWPFTVYNYEGAALGALTGAKNISTDVAGASTAQKMLGGAMSGAASGAMIGSMIPGIGTVAGAIAGGVLGAASGLL